MYPEFSLRGFLSSQSAEMRSTSTDPDQNASIMGDMVMYILAAGIGIVILILLLVIKKMFSSLRPKI